MPSQIDVIQHETRERNVITELEETDQNQIKTEMDVATLTCQLQQLSIAEPQRYLRFFTREMITLLTVVADVLGFAADIQYQRNVNAKLKEQTNTQNKAISFLYDKMKDAHKVAFDTNIRSNTVNPKDIQIPNAKWGWSIMASKPVISEQEVEAKKAEYKLT